MRLYCRSHPCSCQILYRSQLVRGTTSFPYHLIPILLLALADKNQCNQPRAMAFAYERLRTATLSSMQFLWGSYLWFQGDLVSTSDVPYSQVACSCGRNGVQLSKPSGYVLLAFLPHVLCSHVLIHFQGRFGALDRFQTLGCKQAGKGEHLSAGIQV